MSAADRPVLPTRWQLLAGLAACRVLGHEGSPWSEIHPSLTQLPTDGLYRYDDLHDGLAKLIEAGLLEDDGHRLTPTPEISDLLNGPPDEAVPAVAARWLTTHPPLWIHTAVRDDTVAPELIPTADAELLEELVYDPDRREALLLAAADKVDATENAALGARGEEHVAESCRQLLKAAGQTADADKVRRVSRVSDALGYDVTSPVIARHETCRMEVKTTRTAGRGFGFYLSRNEARTGSRDSNWALVACRERPDGIEIVGWTGYAAIADLLPDDRARDDGARSRWASVQIHLPAGCLTPGLPLE